MDPGRLDRIIHQPVRLRILAALYRNRRLAFTRLRDGLRLTAGNLGAHAQKLEEARYVRSRRVLSPTGFVLVYEITPEGQAAFKEYTSRLRALLDAAALEEEKGGA